MCVQLKKCMFDKTGGNAMEWHLANVLNLNRFNELKSLPSFSHSPPPNLKHCDCVAVCVNCIGMCHLLFQRLLYFHVVCLVCK